MRTFRQGDPARIAKVKAEALHVTFMDGDGCQAPGAITIRKVRADDEPGGPEYAVHFANTQCGGYHGGSYVGDLATAHERFTERLTRYDPDGSRRASFHAGTGEPHEATA